MQEKERILEEGEDKKNLRVTIIGSLKSGLDLAAECANVNGENYFLHKIQKDLFGFPASLPSY